MCCPPDVAECSSRKATLPEVFGYDEEQRVCDHCFDVLQSSDVRQIERGEVSPPPS